MVSPADLPHLRPVKPVLFPASDPERVVEGETTPCFTLGLHWVVAETQAPSSHTLSALRLAADPAGRNLVLLDAEERDTEAKKARDQAKRADAEAKKARDEAKKARAEAKRADDEARKARAAEAEVARLRAQLQRPRR
jgi:hypothetical protein